MVANLACIGYYVKHRREERKLLLHLCVPALGFIVALAAPLSYAAYAMAIWMLFGIGTLFYLKSKNPKAIDEMETVSNDSESPITGYLVLILHTLWRNQLRNIGVPVCSCRGNHCVVHFLP